jgi:hypothetical protein
MVPTAEPGLMKHVASFLLASGPTWRPPLPLESRLPHNHLYSSPRRFPVESHLLLGCSHKIPNWTSVTSGLSSCGRATHNMASGLSRRSTVASNTTSGPRSQGPSRHVLPHASPGFLAGRGYIYWWSSPNVASILVDPRDGILALCSGGRTHEELVAKL